MINHPEEILPPHGVPEQPLPHVPPPQMQAPVQPPVYNYNMPKRPSYYEPSLAHAPPTYYPQSPMMQQPQMMGQPMPMPTNIVITGAHGGCAACGRGYPVEATNCCAMTCLILLVIFYFPIGLAYLCCMLPNAYYMKCNMCGLITQRRATPIYVCFFLFFLLEIIAVVALIVLWVTVWNKASCATHISAFGVKACY